MKQVYILLFSFPFFSHPVQAQESNCEVAVEAIRGTYSGDCSGGKASGHGKSAGKDVYEGDFKKGYPDGKGKYTWSNNNYYEGYFKKGHMEGEGEMHYAVAGQDSVVKGFWKNDQYIGLYEKAYIVRTQTGHISKVDCRIISKKGNNITLTTHQLSGTGSPGISGGISINSIVVATGSYYTKTDQALNAGTSTRLQDVIFPFRAVFYLSNGDQTEIIFNQAAEYDVQIDIL